MNGSNTATAVIVAVGGDKTRLEKEGRPSDDRRETFQKG